MTVSLADPKFTVTPAVLKFDPPIVNVKLPVPAVASSGLSDVTVGAIAADVILNVIVLDNAPPVPFCSTT